jgi:hypothetical protein
MGIARVIRTAATTAEPFLQSRNSRESNSLVEEPSVPRQENYAPEAAPFDRYGISLRPLAADFHEGTDGSNTFPSATGSVSGMYSVDVRCRIGRPDMVVWRSRTIWP